VLVVVFYFVPFALNIQFAFSNWTSFSSLIQFTGVANFELLAQQGILFHAIDLTLAYAVIAMVVQNVVSLPLALALQETTAINAMFRSLFFLPVLIAPVAAGFIWSALLSPGGPYNAAIAIVIPGFDHAWFGDPATALFCVAFVDAWKFSGIITLVYIAGLNSIPASLVEAARIDGAGAWKTFWRVRFPMLTPAFTFNIVVTLVGALSAYDVVLAITRGGPGNATTVLNIAMMNQWASGFFGTGSALSFTLTVLVIVLAIPLIWWLRRREVEA
jgi:multiple sugar transport system permease protein/raffinose/stachyose/melibiose transport system permease protein